MGSGRHGEDFDPYCNLILDDTDDIALDVYSALNNGRLRKWACGSWPGTEAATGVNLENIVGGDCTTPTPSY